MIGKVLTLLGVMFISEAAGMCVGERKYNKEKKKAAAKRKFSKKGIKK